MEYEKLAKRNGVGVKFTVKPLLILCVIFCLGIENAPASPRPVTAIVVDKTTNVLTVRTYKEGSLDIIKTYKATLGQVKGDKEEEGDLKTPEGIYVLKSKTTPPTLPKKFGSRAFNLNYPNTFDELAGHTGSHIMLHATDDPKRLDRSFDSLGCVVVRDDEIREIESYITLGLTPILIFPEGTQNLESFMKPGQDPELKGFFKSWVDSWESKDIEKYIVHYHSDFKLSGRNRDGYKKYKASLNKTYETISINPENVLYFRHPKYSMITFTQNYYSKLRGGGVGHKSRGTKILYVAEEEGKPKIIAESYTTLMW